MVRLLPVFALLVITAACSQEQPSPAEETATPSPAATVAERPPTPDPVRYTSLEDCQLLRSAPEEAGFFEYECAGEGGWRLRHTESDLRENLVLIAPDGAEHDLGLVALAQGAFSDLGNKVEWRGSDEGGQFVPRSLILRQQVMEDPDPVKPERSYLIAVRLTPSPCVLARVIPGALQNERAREVADKQQVCLSGN